MVPLHEDMTGSNRIPRIVGRKESAYAVSELMPKFYEYIMPIYMLILMVSCHGVKADAENWEERLGEFNTKTLSVQQLCKNYTKYDKGIKFGTNEANTL